MKTEPVAKPGRLVRMDQLFVQPRVHYSWIVKSRELRFELPSVLARDFKQLWDDYSASGYPSPADYLNEHPLTEADVLFALFCSACYLIEEKLRFQIDIRPYGLSMKLS